MNKPNRKRLMEQNQRELRPISSRRDETTIAQSRPCGIGKTDGERISPEGTAESLVLEREQNGTFSRPFGTKNSSRRIPNPAGAGLGYSQSSLRDGVLHALVLVALDRKSVV